MSIFTMNFLVRVMRFKWSSLSTMNRSLPACEVDAVDGHENDDQPAVPNSKSDVLPFSALWGCKP